MKNIIKSLKKILLTIFFILFPITISTNTNPKGLINEDLKNKMGYIRTINFFKNLNLEISNPDNLPIHLPFIYSDIYRISSKFGEYRNFPIKHTHKGVDFSGKKGSPIFSSTYGTVIIAGRSKGYGKLIIIQHENNLQTIYAHLDKILVKKGDFIKENHIIGTLGNTGWSTGPHLHFEVLKNGKPIDPLIFYNIKNVNMINLINRANFYKKILYGRRCYFKIGNS